jgi:hypothetical protein
MKKLSLFITAALLVSVFANRTIAQESDGPSILVFSQNMVKMSDMGKVQKMMDSLFVPILNSMVDEGKINAWGQLNHAWGDEWNFNLWYMAKDMSSFEKFWSEYVDRVRTKHPDAFGKVVSMFQAHKDNMYSIVHNYSGK